VVPEIDCSHDPLLAGRIHSYLDTQISRLGGPNCHAIPINAPLAPVHNDQRDGIYRDASAGRAPWSRIVRTQLAWRRVSVSGSGMLLEGLGKPNAAINEFTLGLGRDRHPERDSDPPLIWLRVKAVPGACEVAP